MLSIAQTMLSQDVCSSVCPSVERRFSIEMAKCIIKLFSPLGSYFTIVFNTKWYCYTPTGTQMQASRPGRQMQGGMKNHDFRPISRFISETIQDQDTDTKECKSEIQATIFNDLEWPLIQISRSCHYLMLNISETVRDTDSYNGIARGTYTQPTQRWHFEWPWVT